MRRINAIKLSLRFMKFNGIQDERLLIVFSRALSPGNKTNTNHIMTCLFPSLVLLYQLHSTVLCFAVIGGVRSYRTVGTDS